MERVDCKFYLFRASGETCALFATCNFMQQVDLKVANELYGIPPSDGSFCRIADPETCWENIKRRSYLSLTASDLPECLFQKQSVDCDSLQLVSGELAGSCARCQYISADSLFALKGMRKVPLPEEFPPASQIVVGCNQTSRMFAQLQEGLVWNGPRPNATFTCVSGNWVGETMETSGAWKSLENLRCEECLQLGSSSLQRFTNVSMPEVYFMEHRLVQVVHGFSGSGSCGFDVCLYGMDMLNTAAQLWNLSVENPKGGDLQLEEMQMTGSSVSSRKFSIVLADAPDWCLEGNLDTKLNLPDLRYPLRVTQHCQGYWTLTKTKQGEVLRYWSGGSSAYLNYECTPGPTVETSTAIADLRPLENFPVDSADPTQFWNLENQTDGSFLIDSSESNACGKQYLTNLGPLIPTSSDSVSLEEWMSFCTTSTSGTFGLYQSISASQATVYTKPEEVGISIDTDNCTALETSFGDAGSDFSGNCPGNQVVTNFCWYQSYVLETIYARWQCCAWTLTSSSFKVHTFSAELLSKNSISCPASSFVQSLGWNLDTIPPVLNGATCMNVWGDPHKGPLALATKADAQKWRLEELNASHENDGEQHWLQTCEVSLTVNNISHDFPGQVKPQRMQLDVMNFAALSSEQQASYNTTAAALIFASRTSESVFFACQLNVLDMHNSTPCARETPMLQADIINLTGKVAASLEKFEVELQTNYSTTCPFLRNISEAAPQGMISRHGWKMSDAFNLLWQQNYAAIPFVSPSKAPFSYTGKEFGGAQLVGFLGLSTNGDSLWGLECPAGAVVASRENTLPHCLQINATEEPWCILALWVIWNSMKGREQSWRMEGLSSLERYYF